MDTDHLGELKVVQLLPGGKSYEQQRSGFIWRSAQGHGVKAESVAVHTGKGFNLYRSQWAV